MTQTVQKLVKTGYVFKALRDPSNAPEIWAMLADKFDKGAIRATYGDGFLRSHIVFDFSSPLALCGKVVTMFSSQNKLRVCRRCVKVHKRAVLEWATEENKIYHLFLEDQVTVTNIRKIQELQKIDRDWHYEVALGPNAFWRRDSK